LYGNALQDDETVSVIKDLKVKVGAKVKNIRLVESGHAIEFEIDGMGAMQLKSVFVKKV